MYILRVRSMLGRRGGGGVGRGVLERSVSVREDVSVIEVGSGSVRDGEWE